MQHEYFCIEQLDLAAKQLHTRQPSFARFALILTDNIVELMLYRRCKQIITEDDGYFSYGTQFGGKHEFDAKTLAKVMGQHFDERPKFCRKQGLLQEDEMDFVIIAHKYRNEVYHVGIRHEDFLFPIAWQYHEFACDIFKKLSPLYRVWSSHDVISETVARHTGSDGIRIESPDDDIAVVTTSLKASKPPLDLQFSEYLGQAAIRRVDEFNCALQWLSEELKVDQSKLLVDLQFKGFVSAEDSPHIEEFSTVSSKEEFERFVSKVRAAWKPKFPASPGDRWMKRAKSLRGDANPLLAMKKFQSILDEMEAIVEIVRTAAIELENYFQLQSDISRGK